jgi:hypothetical protein
LECLERRLNLSTFQVGSLADLRAAVAASNSSSGNTIFLAPGTYDLSSDGLGELRAQNASNLSFRAAGQGVVLDGGGTTRILEVDGGSVTLSGLTLQNGSADGSAGGGAVYAKNSRLSIEFSVLNANHADSASQGGGAVLGTFSTVSVSTSSFTGNHADRSVGGGGAIDLGGGALSASFSTFSGNHADGAGGGGAILVSGGAGASSASLGFSVLDANHADGASIGGGAVLARSSTLGAVFTSFTNNHADGGGGGAIASDGGGLSLSICPFTGNHADGGGGGGAVLASGLDGPNTASFSLCTFDSNRAGDASGGGGAILGYGSTLTFTRVRFSANSPGGLMVIQGNADVNQTLFAGDNPNDLAFGPGGTAHVRSSLVGLKPYGDATLP